MLFASSSSLIRSASAKFFSWRALLRRAMSSFRSSSVTPVFFSLSLLCRSKNIRGERVSSPSVLQYLQRASAAFWASCAAGPLRFFLPIFIQKALKVSLEGKNIAYHLGRIEIVCHGFVKNAGSDSAFSYSSGSCFFRISPE